VVLTTHPPPSSAEVKERVVLYLHSRLGLCDLLSVQLYLYLLHSLLFFQYQVSSPLLDYGCFECLMYCEVFFIRLHALPSPALATCFCMYSDDMYMSYSCVHCLVP